MNGKSFGTLIQLLVIAAASAAPQAGLAKPKILIVSAEENGRLKTGGLGDFTEGFRKMLAEAGYEVDLALPGYQSLFDAKEFNKYYSKTADSVRVSLDRGHPNAPVMEVYQDAAGGNSRTFLFRHTESDPEHRYFHNPPKPGQRPYYGTASRESEEFGVFDKAVAEWAARKDYDIVIINDWHTGLVAPALKDAGSHAKVWGFVHNMRYQGRASGELARTLQMSQHFHPSGIEYYGDTSSLKALLQYSDGITVVSRNHAQEITTELFGEGLDGLAREAKNQFRLTGIPNGMDPRPWDPTKLGDFLSKMKKLPAPSDPRVFEFSAADLAGKARGKKLLQALAGLPQVDSPLIALTARLDFQKGTDYAIEAMKEMIRSRKAAGKPVQFVVIGDGDPALKASLEALAKDPLYRDHLRYLPFDPESERLAVAFADVLANPSRYEPCGLNYLYAMSNGTIPLVSDRGGHLDLVSPGKTGFMFEVDGMAKAGTGSFRKTQANLTDAFRRVLETFDRDPDKITELRKAAMAAENSWSSRLPQYEAMMDYLLMDGPAKIRAASARAPEQVLAVTDLLALARKKCAKAGFLRRLWLSGLRNP